MFCTKCGKEIADNSTICMGCGCAVKGGHDTAFGEGTVIRSSKGKLFGVSMMSGGIFGLIFAIMLSAGNGGVFVAMLLFCGLAFGLLMYGGMSFFVARIENGYVKNKRAEISQRNKIYFEGAANRDGNGGWLFVTDTAIEHHAHNTNFDTQSTILELSEVVCIRKDGKKLVVVINKYTYKFVVDSIDQWMGMFNKYENTRNKVNSAN